MVSWGYTVSCFSIHTSWRLLYDFLRKISSSMIWVNHLISKSGECLRLWTFTDWDLDISSGLYYATIFHGPSIVILYLLSHILAFKNCIVNVLKCTYTSIPLWCMYWNALVVLLMLRILYRWPICYSSRLCKNVITWLCCNCVALQCVCIEFLRRTALAHGCFYMVSKH